MYTNEVSLTYLAFFICIILSDKTNINAWSMMK